MKGLSDSKKSEIGAQVRAARKRLAWSQQRLADESGQQQATIAKIETGGSYSLGALLAVSHLLKIKMQLDDSIAPLRPPHLSPFSPRYRRPMTGNVHIEPVINTTRAVPVVSWATAGAAKDYHDLADFLDEKVVTECQDANAFAVIVDGDSMAPDIRVGDRVVVSPNKEAQSGNIVIARTRKDHGVYLKKFLRFGQRSEKVRLISVNPGYPALEFDLTDFRFIYPVVGLFRKL